MVSLLHLSAADVNVRRWSSGCALALFFGGGQEAAGRFILRLQGLGFEAFGASIESNGGGGGGKNRGFRSQEVYNACSEESRSRRVLPSVPTNPEP